MLYVILYHEGYLIIHIMASEKEVMETAPFTIVSHNIEYLGVTQLKLHQRLPHESKTQIQVEYKVGNSFELTDTENDFLNITALA